MGIRWTCAGCGKHDSIVNFHSLCEDCYSDLSETDKLLLKGINSGNPIVASTDGYWEEKKRKLIERLNRKTTL